MFEIDSVLYAVGESIRGEVISGGVSDEVAMGSWRSNAQQSEVEASAADESVWYQDSYETQWS